MRFRLSRKSLSTDFRAFAVELGWFSGDPFQITPLLVEYDRAAFGKYTVYVKVQVAKFALQVRLGAR